MRFPRWLEANRKALGTPATWAAVTLRVEAKDENDDTLWVLHESEVRVNDGDSITFEIPVRRTDDGLVLVIKVTDA